MMIALEIRYSLSKEFMGENKSKIVLTFQLKHYST